MLRYVLRLPSELPRFSILRKSFFTSSINFGGGPRPPKNKRLRNASKSPRHRLEDRHKVVSSFDPKRGTGPARPVDRGNKWGSIAPPRPIPHVARPSRFATPVGSSPIKRRSRHDRPSSPTSYRSDKRVEPSGRNNPPESRPKYSPPRHQPSAHREFKQPTEGEIEQALLKSLPQRFISPPLLPGLLTCLNDVLAPNARPFPIQRLSLHHFFPSLDSHTFTPPSSETLLASETGSGKSIAYLLPLLQALKQSEIPDDTSPRTNLRRPRALIIAPTHELCRQLSSQSKSLSHEIKLRTVCLSNPSRRVGNVKALRDLPDTISELQPFGKTERQPDIMVGTPSKIAHLAALVLETDQESPAAASRPKGINFTRPEISFEAVEWVVIDEADVLFDRDYRQTITAILDAARLARMRSQPDSTTIPFDSKWTSSSHSTFNLILTTATIPASLNAYLLEHFPRLVRIASPNLHRLPRAVHTERVDTAGGNPLASIHKKLVDIFAEGSRRAVRTGGTASDSNSQVILFCNRANKAAELGAYLESMGLTCLVMTGSSDGRRRGSNKHLEGFLVPKPGAGPNPIDPDAPRILITTSLLARGLDFAPTVSHVLIADEPRNEVDFLHRAGRTGRAGRSGTVVVFGKGVARRGPKKVGFA